MMMVLIGEELQVTRLVHRSCGRAAHARAREPLQNLDATKRQALGSSAVRHVHPTPSHATAIDTVNLPTYAKRVSRIKLRVAEAEKAGSKERTGAPAIGQAEGPAVTTPTRTLHQMAGQQADKAACKAAARQENQNQIHALEAPWRGRTAGRQKGYLHIARGQKAKAPVTAAA